MRIITILSYRMISPIKSLILLLRNRKGQSLAEFAVITAMMATFVGTAVPKFSDVMETGKANKTIQELDKILVQAKNFYETTAALEGRGRLPGQDKHDMSVGGYTDSLTLFNDLELFTSHTNEDIGKKWISVFGINHADAPMPMESFFTDDTLTPDGSGYTPGGKKNCQNCADDRGTGSEDWIELFTGEALESPFQDGHYIYVVIAGSGTGESTRSPKICVADAESPKSFHKYIDL